MWVQMILLLSKTVSAGMKYRGGRITSYLIPVHELRCRSFLFFLEDKHALRGNQFLNMNQRIILEKESTHFQTHEIIC